MTWPTTPVPTANLDAGGDFKQLARADLLAAVQATNQLIENEPVLRFYSYGAFTNADHITPLYLTYFSSFLVASAGNMTVNTSEFIAPRAGIVCLRSPRCEVVATSGSPTGARLSFERRNSAGAVLRLQPQPLTLGLSAFEIFLPVDQGDRLSVSLAATTTFGGSGAVTAVLSGYTIAMVA